MYDQIKAKMSYSPTNFSNPGSFTLRSKEKVLLVLRRTRRTLFPCSSSYTFALLVKNNSRRKLRVEKNKTLLQLLLHPYIQHRHTRLKEKHIVNIRRHNSLPL